MLLRTLRDVPSNRCEGHYNINRAAVLVTALSFSLTLCIFQVEKAMLAVLTNTGNRVISVSITSVMLLEVALLHINSKSGRTVD